MSVINIETVVNVCAQIYKQYEQMKSVDETAKIFLDHIYRLKMALETAKEVGGRAFDKNGFQDAINCLHEALLDFSKWLGEFIEEGKKKGRVRRLSDFFKAGNNTKIIAGFASKADLVLDYLNLKANLSMVTDLDTLLSEQQVLIGKVEEALHKSERIDERLVSEIVRVTKMHWEDVENDLKANKGFWEEARNELRQIKEQADRLEKRSERIENSTERIGEQGARMEQKHDRNTELLEKLHLRFNTLAVDLSNQMTYAAAHLKPPSEAETDTMPLESQVQEPPKDKRRDLLQMSTVNIFISSF